MTVNGYRRRKSTGAGDLVPAASSDAASTFFRLLPVAMLIQSASGRILEANPAAATLLGCTVSDLYGLTLADRRLRLRTVGRGWLREAGTPSRQATRLRRPVGVVELVLTSSDRPEIRLEIHSAGIKDGDGEVTTVLSVLTDVTATVHHSAEGATGGSAAADSLRPLSNWHMPRRPGRQGSRGEQSFRDDAGLLNQTAGSDDYERPRQAR